MGLVSLASIRQMPGTGGGIEYGSDGSPYGGVSFTPWPGLVNDAASAPAVTQDVAEGLPGVGRGVELISGVIGQLRPQLYENDDLRFSPTRQMDTPNLLRNPDPTWHPLPTWLTAAVNAMAWHGNAYAYKGAEVSDYRGYPLSLPLFDPTLVWWDSTNYVVNGTSAQTPVEVGEMFHALVAPRAGRRLGRGILERYQTELKLMVATEQAQYVLMRDGKPMGILSLGVDVTPEEAGEYKQGFLNAVRESGVAAIGNADFKPVQWSSADMSMVPTREFNLRLASDITGVPPYLLGVPSESRVYANMETEWSNFIRVTLGRYLAPLEAALSECFPSGKTVHFNTDQLLRADASARWAVYQTATSIGALTIDEVRDFERLPPLPPSAEPIIEDPAPQEDEDNAEDDPAV